MQYHLLLVEDEDGLRMTLGDRLANEGYVLHTESDGESGLAKALSRPFDLILLDVMLPKMNGYDVLKELRQHGIGCPVLMISAKSQIIDKVLGLKLGADDYVTKPFDMMELLARIEAGLRRGRQQKAKNLTDGVLIFGNFELHPKSAELLQNGSRIDLSAREFQLLRYFLQHRGELITRDMLLNEVWGYDAMPSTRTVDVHVAWLRQKIEDTPKSPKFLLTIHGLGYKFALPEE